MAGLRLAVFIYCCCAVIACGWYLSEIVKSLQILQPQLIELATELQEFKSEEQRLFKAWQDLDSKQRRERGNYDGPEAVDASYETQLALAALNQSQFLTKAVETQFDRLELQRRKLTGWITPLIVLSLIHLLGVVGLWPKRTRLDSR